MVIGSFNFTQIEIYHEIFRIVPLLFPFFVLSG